MRKMHDLAAEFKFDFGIVVLPSRRQVVGEYREAKLQSKVREIAEAVGFFVIDPLTEFRERRDRINSLYIPYDLHHPSALGHQLVADCIADGLRHHMGSDLAEYTKSVRRSRQ
jgi:hypothetical protein